MRGERLIHIRLRILAIVLVFLAFATTAQAQITDTGQPPDPARSSLLVMPTGRTLPGGTGTAGLAAPWIPYAAWSPADHWQLSAGGIYIFEGAVESGEAYYSYAILKHSLFDDGATSIAVGGAVLFWGQRLERRDLDEWDRAVIPGVFAITTIGNENNALTLGLGFAEMQGGFGLGFDGGLLAGIGLGYEARLSPQWKIMTEHFSNVLSNGTLHTVGLRYFSGRAAFDLGIVVIPNGAIDLPSGTRMPRVLPVLGVSVHIG